MSGSGSFKRISVTPAAEEDVVIHAGISDEGDSGCSGEGSQAELRTEPSRESFTREPLPAACPDGESHSSADRYSSMTELNPGSESAPRSGPSRKSGSARSKSVSNQDAGYHETTLEDLKDNEMPLAQRIVIIAAVVCIIGALVYYFGFMR